MISVILFTLLIAVLIFFYMRHTARKRKKQSAELNSVKDFHASYDRVKTRRELRDRHSGYQIEKGADANRSLNICRKCASTRNRALLVFERQLRNRTQLAIRHGS